MNINRFTTKNHFYRDFHNILIFQNWGSILNSIVLSTHINMDKLLSLIFNKQIEFLEKKRGHLLIRLFQIPKENYPQRYREKKIVMVSILIIKTKIKSLT